jgi:hypothetical protein
VEPAGIPLHAIPCFSERLSAKSQIQTSSGACRIGWLSFADRNATRAVNNKRFWIATHRSDILAILHILEREPSIVDSCLRRFSLKDIICQLVPRFGNKTQETVSLQLSGRGLMAQAASNRQRAEFFTKRRSRHCPDDEGQDRRSLSLANVMSWKQQKAANMSWEAHTLSLAFSWIYEMDSEYRQLCASAVFCISSTLIFRSI